jgi:hypothetical protein
MWVAFAGPEGGSTELVRRGFGRAGRVRKPPGRFHQVDSLAAWTLEPPGKIAPTRPWLRRLRMSLMEDRSPTVTTGLSSVIDLERLSPAAVRIAAAAPKVGGLQRRSSPLAAVFTSVRPLDRKWASLHWAGVAAGGTVSSSLLQPDLWRTQVDSGSTLSWTMTIKGPRAARKHFRPTPSPWRSAVATLASRHSKRRDRLRAGLELVLDQRSADMADLPGGASGLLCRDYEGDRGRPAGDPHRPRGGLAGRRTPRP